MKARFVVFIIVSCILFSCKKESIDPSLLSGHNWYISSPAPLVNTLPISFGADSIYYYNTQPAGTWKSISSSQITLHAPFGGADSIEFEILDLRGDYLRFKITKSTLAAQKNQVVEADTIP